MDTQTIYGRALVEDYFSRPRCERSEVADELMLSILRRLLYGTPEDPNRLSEERLEALYRQTFHR